MKKILVYRIGSLGDSIVALPALLYLRAKHPNSKFYLLTDKSKTRVGSQEIFKIYNIFHKYFYYSKKSELFQMFHKLRKYNFDLVYNLAPDRNRLQKFLDFFYFKTLAKGNYYFDKSKKLNIEEFKRLLSICDNKADFKDYIPMNNLNSTRNNIVFCCGSKKQDYQWNIENYAKIGKFINHCFPKDKIIFMGDKYDYLKSQQIIDKINNGINYCGKYNIIKSIRLFETIKFYFGENTGNMHMAGLSGCKSIALDNYRFPVKVWRPLTKSVQIFPKHKCSYINNVCMIHSNNCVNSIEPKMVIKEIKNFIK